MRTIAKHLVLVLALGCGGESSVPSPAQPTSDASADGGSGGDGSTTSPGGSAFLNTPAAGTIRGKTFTLRSASLRLEPGKRVLTLRDYESNCGVTQGSLPPADSMAVHVVVLLEAPGEERIQYADNHSATFQTGIDPATAQTIAAKEGRLRLDTFSTVIGEKVNGALILTADDATVSGTFTAGVCQN
jgi:hypothetical protein